MRDKDILSRLERIEKALGLKWKTCDHGCGFEIIIRDGVPWTLTCWVCKQQWKAVDV